MTGLTLVGTPGGVTVTARGRAGHRRLPAGDCTIAVGSDGAEVTTVSVDGRTVLTPPATYARTSPASSPRSRTPARERTGLTLTLTTDTRFVTPHAAQARDRPVCLAELVALGPSWPRPTGQDRRAASACCPRGWWQPRPVDGAVTALLGLWWVVGAGTVDDGYVAGIVRGRGDNGFVGNVYRWLNAPEAPFSWLDEPYSWWSQVSASTPWMRLPSTLLGLLCWALVSRLLPARRLGAGAAGRGPPRSRSPPGGCR